MGLEIVLSFNSLMCFVFVVQCVCKYLNGWLPLTYEVPLLRRCIKTQNRIGILYV